MTETQTKPTWENVTGYTDRLRVDGGYLYRISSGSGAPASALCFVPDSAETILQRMADRADAEASADKRVLGLATVLAQGNKTEGNKDIQQLEAKAAEQHQRIEKLRAKKA